MRPGRLRGSLGALNAKTARQRAGRARPAVLNPAIRKHAGNRTCPFTAPVQPAQAAVAQVERSLRQRASPILQCGCAWVIVRVRAELSRPCFKVMATGFFTGLCWPSPPPQSSWDCGTLLALGHRRCASTVLLYRCLRRALLHPTQRPLPVLNGQPIPCKPACSGSLAARALTPRRSPQPLSERHRLPLETRSKRWRAEISLAARPSSRRCSARRERGF